MAERVVEWEMLQTPYEDYLERRGIPIQRGFACESVANLELTQIEPGIQAKALQLDGYQGLAGSLVYEIEPGTNMPPQRHLYEEWIIVISGEGMTEFWTDTSGPLDTKSVVEVPWRENSIYAVPLNSWHRIHVTGNTTARFLSVSMAPLMFDILRTEEAIFNCDLKFDDRMKGLYAPGTSDVEVKLGKDSVTGRAILQGAVAHDIGPYEIPLDEYRGPSARAAHLDMAGNIFGAHLAEFPQGKYSRAHAHFGGASLIALGGEGFSLAWRPELGRQPFAEGNEEGVMRIDYQITGISAVGTGWFHQHFSTGRKPMKQLAIRYGWWERPALFLTESLTGFSGPRTVEFWEEDPYIRNLYAEKLALNGLQPQMGDEIYVG
jgi:mannose-6-phosphate isomerase-like protein (cupin superfamily)